MGIGAALDGTPFVHVARLLALVRALLEEVVSVFEGAGEGRGDTGRATVCCGTVGALSRAAKDLLNHEDVFEVKLGVESGESLGIWPLISDCLRPRSREAEDFGRRGSNASAKYSWPKACDEVGLFSGSHMRHHVTKCARLAGHCGAWRIVSIECGAICSS
jgi:hypothetical protein